MKSFPYTFKSWPRDASGNPVFTCSEQATYYAHLCSHEISEVDRLTYLRKKTYHDIGVIRSTSSPNLQRMMDLAFKAQMYRECLEEITRINESQYYL